MNMAHRHCRVDRDWDYSRPYMFKTDWGLAEVEEDS